MGYGFIPGPVGGPATPGAALMYVAPTVFRLDPRNS